MPKKTREQKIIAAYRRQMQQHSPLPEFKASSSVNGILVSSPEDSDNKKYFVRDIRKSFILIAIVIVAEFVVYGLVLRGVINI